MVDAEQNELDLAVEDMPLSSIFVKNGLPILSLVERQVDCVPLRLGLPLGARYTVRTALSLLRTCLRDLALPLGPGLCHSLGPRLRAKLLTLRGLDARLLFR